MSVKIQKNLIKQIGIHDQITSNSRWNKIFRLIKKHYQLLKNPIYSDNLKFIFNTLKTRHPNKSSTQIFQPIKNIVQESKNSNPFKSTGTENISNFDFQAVLRFWKKN